MGQIDSIGTYIGVIKESGLAVTKKSNYPQWIARLAAVQKWVDTPEDMAHFSLTAPGYVDWASFNEDTVAYMVLFKSTNDFSKETSLLNYDQLQLATGWNGQDFDSLIDGSLIGKQILFRVEENTYKGKTGLQVSWIDAADAPPERQLKSLDSAAVKELSKLLKISKPTAPAKPAVAAKPVTKPTKVTPATNPTPASQSPAAPNAQTSSPVAAPTPTATIVTSPSEAPKPPKKKAAAAPPPPTSTAVAGLPKETTQADAWGYVISAKGDNEDTAVEEAWLAACGEVGENKDEADFTGTDWAKVRDIVIKDLDLKTPVGKAA